MLNVESDDIGLLERRRCGCPFGELGLDRHLSGVHSYEKLTSEGMSYTAAQVMRLMEEELPRRLGGYPSQFQLAETEEDGIPIVELVVSPEIGDIDEAAALAIVYECLDREPGGDLMSGFWREAATVRVVRREPLRTATAKVHPVVSLRPASSPRA
jgi:hypothetical protein